MLQDQIRIPENDPQYAALLEEGREVFQKLPKEAQIAMLSLHRAIRDLNPAIKESGGKTTITAGITVELPDGSAIEVIGQVGDSGAVKVREDGSAEDLVQEDSLVDTLVMMGEITLEQTKDTNFEYKGPFAEQLRAEIKRTGAKDTEPTIKNLRLIMTGGIGAPKAPMVRMTAQPLEPGESIYYMSDGLRDDITDKEGNLDLERIGKIVHKSKNPKEACAALNAEANEGRKKDDKIVVAKVRQRLEEIPSEELIEEEEEEEEISSEDIIKEVA